MAKCGYCSTEHSRKGKFCSDSCKQKDYRRRNTTVTEPSRNVTVSQRKRVTVKMPLRARPVLEFTGQMTTSERASYKPAEQLGRGQLNPVSKPGVDDYVGVCTEEWIADKE